MTDQTTPPIPARGDGSVAALKAQMTADVEDIVLCAGMVGGAKVKRFEKNLDALDALVSTSRAEALEEAARTCEKRADQLRAATIPAGPELRESYSHHSAKAREADVCAQTIRALSSSVPPGNER